MSWLRKKFQGSSAELYTKRSNQTEANMYAKYKKALENVEQNFVIRLKRKQSEIIESRGIVEIMEQAKVDLQRLQRDTERIKRLLALKGKISNVLNRAATMERNQIQRELEIAEGEENAELNKFRAHLEYIRQFANKLAKEEAEYSRTEVPLNKRLMDFALQGEKIATAYNAHIKKFR